MECEAVPFSSGSPPVCLELYVPSVKSEPKTQTFLLLSPHVGENVRRQNCRRTGHSSEIRLHNQESNNFLEEQQENTKWSGLARYVFTFPAFPVWNPNKGLHYTPSGLRGQCPQAGFWLLTYHITNIIIFRAAGGKIWAWGL
jgi:hypothetical protein